VCLVSAGEISLNRISRNPRSGTTRNPLVPYANGVGSPISYTVESRCLPLNISILQTCKTINIEGTPILYERNRFLLAVDLDNWGRDESPIENRLPDARNHQIGRPISCVASTPQSTPSLRERAIEHDGMRIVEYAPPPLLQPRNSHFDTWRLG
jgi:hypothetical protein